MSFENKNVRKSVYILPVKDYQLEKGQFDFCCVNNEFSLTFPVYNLCDKFFSEPPCPSLPVKIVNSHKGEAQTFLWLVRPGVGLRTLGQVIIFMELLGLISGRKCRTLEDIKVE